MTTWHKLANRDFNQYISTQSQYVPSILQNSTVQHFAVPLPVSTTGLGHMLSMHAQTEAAIQGVQHIARTGLRSCLLAYHSFPLLQWF